NIDFYWFDLKLSSRSHIRCGDLVQEHRRKTFVNGINSCLDCGHDRRYGDRVPAQTDCRCIRPYARNKYALIDLPFAAFQWHAIKRHCIERTDSPPTQYLART